MSEIILVKEKTSQSHADLLNLFFNAHKESCRRGLVPEKALHELLAATVADSLSGIERFAPSIHPVFHRRALTLQHLSGQVAALEASGSAQADSLRLTLLRDVERFCFDIENALDVVAAETLPLNKWTG